MEMYNAFYSDGDIDIFNPNKFECERNQKKKQYSYHNGLNNPMSSI